MPRSALLLGSMIVGAAMLAPPGATGGLGLASAEAAAGYHTRKKINGKWVVGKFPNGGAKQAAAAKKGARRVRFTEKKGLAKARYASLPQFKPKVVLREPTPAIQPQKPDVAVAPAAPTAAPQPSPALAVALPPDRVIATASIAPAPAVHPGAERMRPALEAKARSLASELGLDSLPLPIAAPAPQLAARSVTFDLEKGERTIVFEDGAAATAPYDKERASHLTGIKPVQR